MTAFVTGNAAPDGAGSGSGGSARALATYRYRTSRVSIGTLFFLFGLAFLLGSFHVLAVTPALVWPMLLISLGAGTLLRRARRLQVDQDRGAQLAVAEERVRIARDLHDIVAHGVSLMTIQIAAARRVGTSKPDAAEQALVAAEQAGRQTLAELDNMLAVLRGADASIGAAAFGTSQAPEGDAGGGFPSPNRAPVPRLADIAALVDNLHDAGLQVGLDVLGDAPSVPASVEVVIYRVVQEALTNAVRYAAGSAVSVQLIYAPDAISVFVDDEGPATTPSARQSSGHGILGMAERVATVGGVLEAGPRDPGPGWRVHARLPVLGLVTA